MFYTEIFNLITGIPYDSVTFPHAFQDHALLHNRDDHKFEKDSKVLLLFLSRSFGLWQRRFRYPC